MAQLASEAPNANGFKIYGGRDPRDMPAYPPDLAARLLLLPPATLKAWVFGSEWFDKKEHQRRRFEPLIEPPNHADRLLSFVNLVEIHVLKSIRRKHLVGMEAVRTGIAHLKQLHPETQHPLADIDLLADGRAVFLQEHGTLLNLSMGKQIAMDFLVLYLRRIERNVHGLAVKLFPFVTMPIRVGKAAIEPDAGARVIAIDPYISFGRPIIDGTGISTDAIADRFWGGDDIAILAKEFDRPEKDIQLALRYEHAQLARVD
jgi:uncharacterized protein (DUF433 family)